MEYARGTGPDDWATEARFRGAKPAAPIMVEGFGALPVVPPKYVPANDNVPYVGDVPGENRRCEGWSSVPVAKQPARGFLAGLTPEQRGKALAYRGIEPAHGDPAYHFNGDNDHMEKTPEERLPGALALLASAPGFIYLGSPYSKYGAGHDAASRVAADAAARLMHRGMVIYSPIAHGHAVAAHGLPLDWAFWKRQCQPMIDAASALVVLTMHGWQESVGLQYEIEEFVRQAKPILHVSPAWLVENDWEAGRAAG